MPSEKNSGETCCTNNAAVEKKPLPKKTILVFEGKEYTEEACS
jgi:hypothetical protein